MRAFTIGYQCEDGDTYFTGFSVEGEQVVMSGEYIWPRVLDADEMLVVGKFLKLLAQGDIAVTVPEAAE